MARSSTGNMNAQTILAPVSTPDECPDLLTGIQKIVSGTIDVIFVHVIPVDLLNPLRRSHDSLRSQAIRTLRESAEQELKSILQNMTTASEVNLQSMVVEGAPYIEIIKLSHDLKVDMIAMRMRSSKSDFEKLEKLMFGGTSERVVRGSTLPVLCLP